MSSISGIRTQIAQTIRIDYSKQSIHHALKKQMDIAPILKPYDYSGLLNVIRTWFEAKIFKYSVLEHWLEPSIKIYYSNTEIRIEGNNHAFNLKHNTGVCCHLAFKCKHMIDLLYPWAQVISIEKLNWRTNGGNHYFLLLPELGVTHNGEYIEPNLNFGDPKRFSKATGSYQLEGLVHVVDPTRSIIGRHLEMPLYSTPITSHLSCHIDFVQSETTINNTKANSSHFIFAHRFDSEEFGSLGFGFDNTDESIKEPFWQLGKETYRFNSQQLIDKVSNLDYEAGVKLAILQRRGFIRC